MKKILYVALYILFATNLKAQIVPEAIVENEEILDVLIMDDEVFYATTKKIIRVDKENEHHIITQFHPGVQFLNGEFEQEDTGWVFVGWQEQVTDYSLGNSIVVHYDGISAEVYNLGTYNLFFQDFIKAVNFSSLDSIIYLVWNKGDYFIRVIDTDLNLIASKALDKYVTDMILLRDNSTLFIGSNTLYLLWNDELQRLNTYDSKIVDIEYSLQDSTIILLTYNDIYILKESLNEKMKISTPQDGFLNKAVYTYNGNTYLVRTKDDKTNIISFNSFGQEIEQFDEVEGIKYKNLKVKDNIFALWGNNSCGIGGDLLKLDTVGVDYAIPTTDLSIDDFKFEHVGLGIDTILSNGDTIYRDRDVYVWSFNVTNRGMIVIDSLTFKSSYIDWVWRPIQFIDNEDIQPNETRSYSGVFKYRPISMWHTPYVHISVGTDIIDSNCDDNTALYKVLTPTDDIASQASIVVFPNPTSDQLNITINDPFDYSIYDSSGRRLINYTDNQSHQIDVSSLQNGLYFIEIIKDGNRHMERFIKE